MYEYFDIHSHLDVSDFNLDREEEIKKMNEQKIGTVTVGVDFVSSQKAVELSETYENVFAGVGQQPKELGVDSVFDDRIKLLANNKKVVTIGECGLDYSNLFKRDFNGQKISPADEYIKIIQKKVFEEHIDSALSVNQPLMLHIRSSKGTQDAYEDILNILEHHANISGSKLKGNVHFFSGDMGVLRRFLDIGFTISFTGVITFTHDYDEYVRFVPTDMIMSETDAPLVTPVPYRGKRNSPLFVTEVVKKIAEIRGEPFQKIKTALVSNALKHFPKISTIASQASL
jgi:TatD DNase family protein